MSSVELTGWQALYRVKAEEAQRAADQASSRDGIVVYHGREDDAEDHDRDEDDDDDELMFNGRETE